MRAGLMAQSYPLMGGVAGAVMAALAATAAVLGVLLHMTSAEEGRKARLALHASPAWVARECGLGADVAETLGLRPVFTVVGHFTAEPDIDCAEPFRRRGLVTVGWDAYHERDSVLAHLSRAHFDGRRASVVVELRGEAPRWIDAVEEQGRWRVTTNRRLGDGYRPPYAAYWTEPEPAQGVRR